MAIKRTSKDQLDRLEDCTDYQRVEKMTEDEIRRNAESDPDAPLPSEEDLKRFERVKPLRGGRKKGRN